MSTHATIRIERTDGTVTGILLSYDGYIENVGVILQKYYSTTDTIEKLLELGDLETIDTDIKTCIAYNRDKNVKFKQSNFKNEYVYTFDALEQVWYVSYPDRKKDEYAKLLCLSHPEIKINELLLSAISKICDDTTIKECTQAAMEAREEDCYLKWEYMYETYRTLCD